MNPSSALIIAVAVVVIVDVAAVDIAIAVAAAAPPPRYLQDPTLVPLAELPCQHLGLARHLGRIVDATQILPLEQHLILGADREEGRDRRALQDLDLPDRRLGHDGPEEYDHQEHLQR